LSELNDTLSCRAIYGKLGSRMVNWRGWFLRMCQKLSRGGMPQAEKLVLRP